MLAVAGGKGGTGKTTTALALAREVDGTTVVVDADVDMPDAHAMAGVSRTPTVLDRPLGTPAPALDGVRVAPAPPANATVRFRAALADLAGDSTPDTGGGVVLDAPCGAGPDAALPLAVADRVVLVTRPTPAGVRDAAKTAAMARALDTPLAAAAVVERASDSGSVGRTSGSRGVERATASNRGGRTNDSVADALGVPAVVSVARVEGDPLASRAHEAAIARLVRAIASAESSERTTGRHLFTE